MSRVVIPLAYIEMIFSSSPEMSFWRFLTIWGSKSDSLSRGTSRSISPNLNLTVLRVKPFLALSVDFVLLIGNSFFRGA
jgi:hypothetical protein